MNPRRHSHAGFARQPRRGSVILFVLGVVLLTAFLLTRLIDRAGGELLAESKAAYRGTLRDEAYSALEVTLAVLADAAANNNGLHSPQEGWDNPLDYAAYQPPAGFDISVSFDDETGKLPLATVSAVVLEHYFESAGATPIDAGRLADALLAWTKTDYLPSSSEADPHVYENATLPYDPPQRPLESFEELRAVAVARDLLFDAEGRWSDLGEKFRADATLHSFSKVNVNSARPAVLVALGLDTTQAAAVAEDVAPAADPNQPSKYFSTIAEAAAAHGAVLSQVGLGADVLCLRVRVTVKQGARVFLLEAVVQPGSSSAPATAAAKTPASTSDPAIAPATPVDPRALTSKSIDYPFRILELRESDGPAQ